MTVEDVKYWTMRPKNIGHIVLSSGGDGWARLTARFTRSYPSDAG